MWKKYVSMKIGILQIQLFDDVIFNHKQFYHFRWHIWFETNLKQLTFSTLMLNTVDILSCYKHLYKQFLKVKYAFNLETLIYVGT